jgi:hypothetical protein
MLSEKILFALNDVDDSLLEETRFFMTGGEGAGKVLTLKRTARTLLIAAVITALLTVTAFAIYRAVMAHRDLKPDDDLKYYLHQEGKIIGDIDLALNHGDCAMALSFTTENPGHACCFRMPNPAKVGEPSRKSSFLEFLEPFDWEGEHQMYDKVQTLEESLQEAGMTKEEAEQWNKMIYYDDENRAILLVKLYDGAYLADTDLILGWPKGEAIVEREEMWNSYHLLEATVTTEWKENDYKTVKHLYLFQPDQQYLLEFCAADDVFTYKDLEQIAETVEVLETNFTYTKDSSSMNWSVTGLASG